MLEHKEVLQRPLLVLSALAFASVALLVSNLSAAWAIPPLRDLFISASMFLLGVGVAGALGELALRVWATSAASKAEEAGRPIDRATLRLSQQIETSLAAAMILAFLAAPVIGAHGVEIREEERRAHLQWEIDRKAAVSKADAQNTE